MSSIHLVRTAVVSPGKRARSGSGIGIVHQDSVDSMEGLDSDGKNSVADDDCDEEEISLSGKRSPMLTGSRKPSMVSEEPYAPEPKSPVKLIPSTPDRLPPTNQNATEVTPEADVTEDDVLEEEDQVWHSRLVQLVYRSTFDPDGSPYFYWKAVLTLAVMYNCIVVILRVAFEDTRDEPGFFCVDFAVDVLNLVDILVQSKVRFLSDGRVITDGRLTLQNYLGKDNLKFDVAAVVPVHVLVTISTGMCNLFGYPVLLIQKNFSVVRPALRFNRLAKVYVMNSFFNKTESCTKNPNFLRALRLSIQLALVIHWTACFYYMISKYEGRGSTDWVYPAGPDFDGFSRKYIICMYWSIMTLTTIGERPSPVTNMEYIFTGLTFLIGVFVFAAVVGNVGEVISNMNAARRDFQTRMDQIKFYLNHRQIPEALQSRIKRWAEYTWDRTKAMDEPTVFQWLPERLRTEVAIHIHLSVLKKVSIFNDCEEGLLRELVLKLKPQIYLPGDYICRIGEVGREMYIVNHGQVEILFPDADTGAMRQVAVMNPGNFFGEISLLKLDDGQNKRTADVRSIGYSELLCLSRRDLMVALTEYPEAKRILEEHARHRFQQTKNQSKSQEGSANSSRRESVTSSGSPTSAKQLFARVMKKEGFASLLKQKDTDLVVIKKAIEDMKENNSAEIHQTIVNLHKEIQEMNRALLHKDLTLQQARGEITYLQSLMSPSHSPRLDSLPNGLSNEVLCNGIERQSCHSRMDSSRSNTSLACFSSHNSSQESMSNSQRFRNHFYCDNDDATDHPINPNNLDQYYQISFPNMSPEADQSEHSLNKSVDIDSSVNSADEDSGEDLAVIEKRFERVGKDNVPNSCSRSHSFNTLPELHGRCSNPFPRTHARRRSDASLSLRLGRSYNKYSPSNLSPAHVTESRSDNVLSSSRHL